MLLVLCNPPSKDNKLFYDLVLTHPDFDEGMVIYDSIDAIMGDIKDLENFIIILAIEDFGWEISRLMLYIEAHQIPCIYRVSDATMQDYCASEKPPYIISDNLKKEEINLAIMYCMDLLKSKKTIPIITKALDVVKKIILTDQNSIWAMPRGIINKYRLDMTLVNFFKSHGNNSVADMIDKSASKIVYWGLSEIMESKFTHLFTYIDRRCIVAINQIDFFDSEKGEVHCKNGEILKVSTRRIADFIVFCEKLGIIVLKKGK